MGKLPRPKRSDRGATMSIEMTPGASKSLIVREIREAQRETQRLARELSQLETIAVAAARGIDKYDAGIGANALGDRKMAFNGWVLSLVESAITLDIIDEHTKTGDTQLADEFISAIGEIKRNSIVWYSRR